MNRMMMNFRTVLLALLALFVLGPGIASAQTMTLVMLDTSALIGAPPGPFSLDFQFDDPAGGGTLSDYATLTSFDFGGGSSSGSPSYFGGAAGDMSSTVTLADDNFINDFTEGFTPGNMLSFTMSLAGTPDANGSYPTFSMAVLDSNGNELPTTGLGDALLVTTLNSSGLSATGYGTDPSQTNIIISPPIFAPAMAGAAVPEPSALVLIGIGALPLALPACKRRRINTPS